MKSLEYEYNCAYNRAAREAVQRALLTAPLPFAGFESLFPRRESETVVYCYPQSSCTQ